MISDIDGDEVETEWSFMTKKVDYVTRAYSNIENELLFLVQPNENEKPRAIQLKVTLTDFHYDEDDPDEEPVSSQSVYRFTINVIEKPPEIVFEVPMTQEVKIIDHLIPNRIKYEQVDTARDGAHFGPNTVKSVGKEIAKYL